MSHRLLCCLVRCPQPTEVASGNPRASLPGIHAHLREDPGGGVEHPFWCTEYLPSDAFAAISPIGDDLTLGLDIERAQKTAEAASMESPGGQWDDRFGARAPVRYIVKGFP